MICNSPRTGNGQGGRGERGRGRERRNGEVLKRIFLCTSTHPKQLIPSRIPIAAIDRIISVVMSRRSFNYSIRRSTACVFLSSTFSRAIFCSTVPMRGGTIRPMTR